MEWDVGFKGLGLLAVMSLGFGLIAQLLAGGATTNRLWLIASAAYLVGALFTSEVWFGGTTEDQLTTFDGFLFDEGLLFGLVFGVAAILVTRFVTRRRRHDRAAPV